MHCGDLLFYRQSFLCFVWMSLNKYTLTEYRVNVLLAVSTMYVDYRCLVQSPVTSMSSVSANFYRNISDC